MMTRRALLTASLLLFLAVSLSAHAAEFRLREAPILAERVKKGTLPPLNARLPKSMLIVSPHEGKDLGVYGGERLYTPRWLQRKTRARP
jgi:hypothetical protein